MYTSVFLPKNVQRNSQKNLNQLTRNLAISRKSALLKYIKCIHCQRNLETLNIFLLLLLIFKFMNISLNIIKILCVRYIDGRRSREVYSVSFLLFQFIVMNLNSWNLKHKDFKACGLNICQWKYMAVGGSHKPKSHVDYQIVQGLYTTREQSL